MTSETTTLTPADTTRGEWQRYRDFLRHPRLPQKAYGFGKGSLVAVLRLLALDLMVMLALIAAAGTAILLGLELPESEIAGLEWSPLVVVLVVLVAPLLEETGFRSWLSGRPGHVLAALLLLFGFFAVPIIAMQTTADQSGLAQTAGLTGGLILAILALFILRSRPPMRWFARSFAFFYAASTLAFALIHLLNYQEGTLAVLLPLVVPQLVAGSIFGYARVTYGLWASVLLHALHNGVAVGAVLIALSLGG